MYVNIKFCIVAYHVQVLGPKFLPFIDRNEEVISRQAELTVKAQEV